MTNARDFTLDSTGDLLIEDGDFVLSNADGMHVEHILSAFPGYYRRAPLVGVGISQYLKSSGKEGEIKRLITIQLEADGYQLKTVGISSDWKVSIDASRIR
jgi:hypothetical protein